MIIFNVIKLFGGLAMFLYGMHTMSGALKESSTGTLKTIMSKLTDNLFKSFLLGIVMTALIQSSTATIVITSGLVSASIIPFKQSLGIIIGANIGTTVTGQIIRLMDIGNSSSVLLQFFKPETLAPIALIVGIILIMFLKFNKSETIGSIFMGFGILFTGLMNMTGSVSQLNDMGLFDSLFVHLGDSPILGYGIGALVSFILQSSSATVGILQAFSVSGQLFFKSIYTVLLGIYLGDCTTTGIVCSIGANSDAKRVGLVNILYNLSESIVVIIGIIVLNALGLLDGIWNLTATSSLIANTNTIFNTICAFILLPLVGVYEKIAYKLVKDDMKPVGKYDELIAGLDIKFIESPAIALNACYQALLTSFQIAYENIQKSFSLLEKYDEKIAGEIEKEEDELDNLTDEISSYLVKLSQKYTSDDLVVRVKQYISVSNEFERLGDHACNIKEAAESLKKENKQFTASAKKEIEILQELTNKILEHTKNAFEKVNVESAYHIEPLEEVMDNMVISLKENHINRLQKGECNVLSATTFLNLLNDIERISDVCSNIGIATISRVNPELALLSHEYITSLHNEKDNDFHKEYKQAHDYYFHQLDNI